ncbi:MAG: peroxiredoxin [Planctomycetes bacterium]|nr:peroxiredoxin [Planctomycetota bacterium]
MPRLRIGDTAPDLTLTTHGGDRVALSDYRGKHVVVLFFYPRDGTPVCTREACAFRDAYEQFVAAGAVVIGISGDTAERHQAFAADHRLPFVLVSDKDGTARRAFGVPKSLGIFPGRVTYVIDHQGTVRHIFNSQFGADDHVREALEVVRKLKP